MTTIRDWPTGDAFKAAAPLQLSLDSSQSTARGFYIGSTQRIGHADRLRAVLTLPPSIDPAAGGQREAFMLWWKSSGGLVRMAMPHRKYPNGTMRGTATLSADAAAGARAISLTGCFSANILSGGSFETDANSDGLADSWAGYAEGSVSGASYGRDTTNPIDGVYEQYVAATTLGTTSADLVGVYHSEDFAAWPGTLTASVRIRGFDGADATIAVKCETADGATLLSKADLATGVAISTPARIGAAFTPHADTRRVTILLYMSRRFGGGTGRAVAFDGVSLSYGNTPVVWPGRATLVGGDYLAIGGNLLCVDYSGATATDFGVMSSVPLSLPLQKAVVSGATVTASAPTGLWELDDSGLQLDYSARTLQAGFAIPIRQYIA